jgi:hypothetical protein
MLKGSVIARAVLLSDVRKAYSEKCFVASSGKCDCIKV